MIYLLIVKCRVGGRWHRRRYSNPILVTDPDRLDASIRANSLPNRRVEVRAFYPEDVAELLEAL